MATTFCNNCGDQGHVFRSCPSPIISCGLLLLNVPTLPADPTKVGILMVRRKDSLSYMEFLRGKYELSNSKYIHTLIRNMTRYEQQKIVQHPFDELWNFMWGDGRDTRSTEYAESAEKFKALDKSRLIRDLPSSYNEPEWGFPKGRRIRRETDVDCAVREFLEETNISRDAYTLCPELSVSETFKGTNDITYRHNYFIALARNPDDIDLECPLTYTQRREISLVAWKTLAECRTLIRPHYVRRVELLDSIAEKLKNRE